MLASISNTANGEVSQETIFHHHQDGNIVWVEYEGGAIRKGYLVAIILEDGRLDMRYHHVNISGEIMIGKCISIPHISHDGRLELQEHWQWLSGDMSSGYSEIIEVNKK
jgi:hypothetical protein